MIGRFFIGGGAVNFLEQQWLRCFFWTRNKVSPMLVGMMGMNGMSGFSGYSYGMMGILGLGAMGILGPNRDAMMGMGGVNKDVIYGTKKRKSRE